jgi:hypothetical protein
MALHLFTLPIQSTAQVFVEEINAATATAASVTLTPDGSNTTLFVSSVASYGAGIYVKVQLPNPAESKGQIRTIVNGGAIGTGAAQILQVYDYPTVAPFTAFSGAVIDLPFQAAAPANGILEVDPSAVSATGANYASVSYYCTGTSWQYLVTNANHSTT